ncbi:PTS sugar transporter subunit IIA [Lentibacillus cibarius]|nr:PTS sugar transporter subunit IIA [Lentibacillus cibarius]
MIGIILTGHGSFPEGLLKSVELIAGEVKQIEVIPFEEDKDSLECNIKDALKRVDTGSGVVCFTDLAGGTPFNVASAMSSTHDNVHVVGGTNSPMLLSGLFQRELAVNEFVELVMNEGKENIKQFEVKEKRQPTKDVDGI